MSRQINIYVEGKTDIAFIGQFLMNRFGIEIELEKKGHKAESVERNPKIRITTLNSSENHGGIDSDKLKQLKIEIQYTNQTKGIESIIIVDADTEDHNSPPGGYQARNNYMEELFADTDAQIFLTPNNNEDGNLETLLESIISDKGKVFHTCLTKYSECLSSIEEEFKPQELLENRNLLKKRVEWYSYMMLGKFNKNDKNNYLNKDLWNIESNELNPLYQFFDELL